MELISELKIIFLNTLIIFNLIIYVTFIKSDASATIVAWKKIRGQMPYDMRRVS